MTVNKCHPLHSVCVLLNAIDDHLSRRDFMSPSLTEDLLPKSTRIVYKSAASDETREDALPIVAYEVGEISITPYMASHHIGGGGGTATEMKGSVHFVVSTTNEALTAELAMEIGAYCMSLHKDLQEYGMNISGITISPVRRGQSNYFESTVQLGANLGKPVWKHNSNSDILREIGISLNII